MGVSGNARPVTSDHFPKADPKKWSRPRIARISYQGDTAACSCGWTTYHQREKVREDRIDRHLTKRHDGRGIRF